jgi:glycosyltransferase involved in cell wall biosynthesis
MRIAIVTWSNRRVGGTEAYLEGIVAELLNKDHQVAFWHEVDAPANKERIEIASEVPVWCAADIGPEQSLTALREWQPDIIYSHSLLKPGLEAAALKIAPGVFFAHAYYGTCISGHKTFKTPVVTPCQRKFGWQCVMHYYPHRCGGLSPVSMLQEYRRQSKRFELLSVYKAIVTHSTHMRDEYIKHGFDPKHVRNLSYYAHQGDEKFELNGNGDHRDSPLPNIKISGSENLTFNSMPAYWRLLFLGRMDFLKGGRLFIDALPKVSEALGMPLRVTFAGDGPDRAAWERKASRVQRLNPSVSIDFAGWVNSAQRDALWSECDLLVLPSVWPEPFGLVGPEAGLHGVPIAAFGVGGITDWLSDGVNGHLARGNPPTAAGLVDAIVKCLRDPATHARLRHGATAMAQRFNMETHLSNLMSVFEEVCSQAA